MAVGDVTSVLSSVNANAFLDIQPASSAEWCITNLYYGGKIEVYFYDGANSILIDSDSTATSTVPGSMQGRCFHVNNTRYIRIKNVDSAEKYLAYDGIVTK